MENIEIKIYEKFDFDKIYELYKLAGWTNYTENPKMLKGSYENALKVIGAFKGENLVGIIKAVGDNYSILYIQDIIVHPVYQRQGIGTALLKEMLKIYSHVYQKILTTDNTEKTLSFYKSCGFSSFQELDCMGFMYLK